MSEDWLHPLLVYGVMGLAVPTFLALQFISAPYGRHARSGWGPTLHAKTAWIFMEIPSALGFVLIFSFGIWATTPAALVLMGLWSLHYFQRTFWFPLRMRPGRRMPVSVMAMGFSFNLINAYINGRWISHFHHYELDWLWDPRFLIGAGLFLLGFWLNLGSDAILRALRRPGEKGYKIPQGGLYRWVSSPNYLGELLEWVGWAIATWSLAGLAFALYTAANLVPRAASNHRWYQEKFSEYPKERRALIPGLW